jgi:hypothetical protein
MADHHIVILDHDAVIVDHDAVIMDHDAVIVDHDVFAQTPTHGIEDHQVFEPGEDCVIPDHQPDLVRRIPLMPARLRALSARSCIVAAGRLSMAVAGCAQRS